MAILKCKMCGGDIEIATDKTFGTCEFCGSTMTFPKIDDEQRAAAFNRGNHFRRIGEFDKALAVYERIVREDDTDAEAHWCCALCRFGIEYVEDPATYEYLPTCHRASFDPFLEDVDYLAAIANSDGITRRQYQKDGAKIADVQRGILATSQNTDPYDIFICYKESDETGSRTRDSIMAQDIYYHLTEQGHRVFFSRITLEDVAGTQYEPYIFAALNSAKVMIVVGTKPEYLNAVWVKNEWSRFLSMIKKDRSKLLLPCYRDMDPYDMPEQLSILQSYDMGKIGFIQDLTRGIKKVLDTVKAEPTFIAAPQSTHGQETAPLLRRIELFLEDREFDRADDFCEQVLNIDPENVAAYFGKLQVEYHCSTRADLSKLQRDISASKNYQKILRFGTPEDIAFITQVSKQIEENFQQMLAHKHKAAESSNSQRDNGLSADNFVDVFCPYCNELSSFPPSFLLGGPVACTACGKLTDYTRNINNIVNISSLEQLTALAKQSGNQVEILPGNFIEFGAYPQGDTNEKSAIEWLVLGVDGSKALLISKYALDCRKFHDSRAFVTWENCSLRSWLNNKFFFTAFQPEEQAMISSVTTVAHSNPTFNTDPGNNTTDKIFLLSVNEAEKYFASNEARACSATDFTVQNGAWVSEKGNCFWWLRTPGDIQDGAAGVNEKGVVDHTGDYVHGEDYAVRPAMWIDLSI